MNNESGNAIYFPAKNFGKFWQLLQEMEEKHERERPFSGSLEYSGFIRAIYHGRVQIGFVDEKE